jgi:hypothetical protein
MVENAPAVRMPIVAGVEPGTKLIIIGSFTAMEIPVSPVAPFRVIPVTLLTEGLMIQLYAHDGTAMELYAEVVRVTAVIANWLEGLTGTENGPMLIVPDAEPVINPTSER